MTPRHLTQRYIYRYKGIMLYFEIMSASLSGRYANFGVFKLYGDKALDRVLEIFFQLVLIVPVEDMVVSTRQEQFCASTSLLMYWESNPFLLVV
jgi:hypothetical protein